MIPARELSDLEVLRVMGWRVGVHNDYQQGEKFMTFWLFTHKPTGRFVKAEAETDAAALTDCLRQVIDAPW